MPSTLVPIKYIFHWTFRRRKQRFGRRRQDRTVPNRKGNVTQLPPLVINSPAELQKLVPQIPFCEENHLTDYSRLNQVPVRTRLKIFPTLTRRSFGQPKSGLQSCLKAFKFKWLGWRVPTNSIRIRARGAKENSRRFRKQPDSRSRQCTSASSISWIWLWRCKPMARDNRILPQIAM